MSAEIQSTDLRHPTIDDICKQVDAVGVKAMQLIEHLQERRDEFKTALNRMVLAHENLSNDTEGKYPPLDAGCIECTAGTVPDRLNTGLCAYHNAKRLLGHE
jgi:hypothetical protein